MRKIARRPITAEINITPLMDLSWTLLVVFILTTVTIVQSVELKLPETRESKEEVPTETATVSIDDQGTVFLNNEPVQLPLSRRDSASTIREPRSPRRP